MICIPLSTFQQIIALYCFNFQSLYLGPIMKFGTESQIEKFAKPFLNGDRVGCFGLSEPGKKSYINITNNKCSLS